MTGDPYSPRRRTALVMSGAGTAGAYHAGALRALHEAGVKVDVVAGRGVGVIGALFAAIDGGQRLWDDKGFWRSPSVASLYDWRPILRVIVWSLAVAVAVLVVPIALVAAGLVVFPIDFILKLVGVSSAAGLVARYLAFAEAAFAPEALPTWLPRLVLLVLAVAAVAAFLSARSDEGGRHTRGALWWRMLRPPLTSDLAIDRCWGALWDLLRGAAQLRNPGSTDLARRYIELLSDNFGQPGFRELVIAAHDVDARRDMLFALVSDAGRRALVRRSTIEETEQRRAEVIDLSGPGRDLLTHAVAASLSVPLITDLHPMPFPADSYWRGETHRLCDRPSSLDRLVEELAAMDVEQVVLVSAAPDPAVPHQLERPPLAGRARLGEYLPAEEASILRDLERKTEVRVPRLFVIRPTHNPIGPFEFDGGFDHGSDRRLSLAELMTRGYEDAYRQFIEPVVGDEGADAALGSSPRRAELG
jgi:hypothetical protein